MLSILFLLPSCIDTIVKVPGDFIYKASFSKCIGCGDCVDPCPEKAIKIIETEDVIIAYIDPDKCTGCGNCYFACKYNALEKKRK